MVSIKTLINAPGMYLKPIYYYFKSFSKNYEMDVHSHRAVEIMYVEYGSATVNIYNAQKNNAELSAAVTLKEQQLIVIDLNTVHRLKTDTDCRILNIEFALDDKKQSYPPIFSHLKNAKSMRFFLGMFDGHAVISDTSRISDIIFLMHRELEKTVRADDSEFFLQNLGCVLFTQIARQFCENFSSYSTSYVKHALKFISANYDAEWISVSVVAEKTGINRSYLSRLFKAEIGLSIVDYINRCRIELAKAMLSENKFSIIEIGVNCGFSTRQNFTHIFKKNTGMSPAEYKRHQAAQTYSIKTFDKPQLFYTTKDPADILPPEKTKRI